MSEAAASDMPAEPPSEELVLTGRRFRVGEFVIDLGLVIERLVETIVDSVVAAPLPLGQFDLFRALAMDVPTGPPFTPGERVSI